MDKPCKWSEEKHEWSCEKLEYDLLKPIYKATPDKEICNTCAYYKECSDLVLYWFKEKEDKKETTNILH